MSTLERLRAENVRTLVHTFRDAVRDHAAGLNLLNVYPVPDGDTGTNMSRTLDAVVAELDAANPADFVAICDAISHGSLMGARGNSGVILSQILRGFAATIKAQAATTEAETAAEIDIDGPRFAEALEAAAAGAYQAVLKPIEGTILTVARESAEGARSAADQGGSLLDVARAARAAGRTALDNTPELLPVLKQAGVVDAGGAGYLLLLDSVLHVVDGEAIPEPTEVAAPDTSALGAAADGAPAVGSGSVGGVDSGVDVSEQRYEVMYFLDLVDESIDSFKQRWGDIGDSIVVVGGDGLWNCHVHTNDIGAAIEAALELDGRPRQIRVTDLFGEVDEEHARREAAMHGDAASASASASASTPRAGAGLPPVTTAIVAVCAGDGLSELFGQLGVQGVVVGGQTMNPSTAELLDTVEAVNADQVIVLPNNKNIIPVAEQVDALTSKRVCVVPTTSMPQALAALVVYDPEADGADNAAEMADAADAVTTGEVTRAVRDSDSAVGAISVDDWIGLARNLPDDASGPTGDTVVDGIVAVAPDLTTAAFATLDVVVGPSAELVTVITGADAADADTVAITSWLAEQRADVAVEVHVGGQPLYPYLFGVE